MGTSRRDQPRIGYTEQPRVLTLGKVVGKGALKVASHVEHGGGTTHESAKRTTSVATFRACVLPGSPRAEALGCSV
jgi:hypothetical protein